MTCSRPPSPRTPTTATRGNHVTATPASTAADTPDVFTQSPHLITRRGLISRFETRKFRSVRRVFYMSDRHWPHPIRRGPALASTALALMGAAAVSGCGGSASPSQSAATQPTGTAPASAAAQVSFTSDQLKGALLAK